jgi:hypothetical protein
MWGRWSRNSPPQYHWRLYGQHLVGQCPFLGWFWKNLDTVFSVLHPKFLWPGAVAVFCHNFVFISVLTWFAAKFGQVLYTPANNQTDFKFSQSAKYNLETMHVNKTLSAILHVQIYYFPVLKSAVVNFEQFFFISIKPSLSSHSSYLWDRCRVAIIEIIGV